ncbi:hypothetical protein IW261DRAFT_1611622 [Armillaria novae-zelandiae]|uniref:Uncharacterized protein n=1 Tax=Armillaria novae-zelandiae TaxID=153914 RepID=A0AA39TWX1_9AGAR|nr:hypothetical protein IW261DRAFT_1611622 [Armillaria novae-zelandiae]
MTPHYFGIAVAAIVSVNTPLPTSRCDDERPMAECAPGKPSPPNAILGYALHGKNCRFTPQLPTVQYASSPRINVKLLLLLERFTASTYVLLLSPVHHLAVPLRKVPLLSSSQSFAGVSIRRREDC